MVQDCKQIAAGMLETINQDDLFELSKSLMSFENQLRAEFTKKGAIGADEFVSVLDEAFAEQQIDLQSLKRVFLWSTQLERVKNDKSDTTTKFQSHVCHLYQALFMSFLKKEHFSNIEDLAKDNTYQLLIYTLSVAQIGDHESKDKFKSKLEETYNNAENKEEIKLKDAKKFIEKFEYNYTIEEINSSRLQVAVLNNSHSKKESSALLAVGLDYFPSNSDGLQSKLQEYGLSLEKETSNIIQTEDKTFESTELNNLCKALVDQNQEQKPNDKNPSTSQIVLIIRNAILSLSTSEKKFNNLNEEIMKEPGKAREKMCLFTADLDKQLQSLYFLELPTNLNGEVLGFVAEILEISREANEKARGAIFQSLYLTDNSDLTKHHNCLPFLYSVFDLRVNQNNKDAIRWETIQLQCKKRISDDDTKTAADIVEDATQELNNKPKGIDLLIWISRKRIEHRRAEEKYYKARLLLILDNFSKGKTDQFGCLNELQQLIKETKQRRLRKQFKKFYHELKQQVMDDQKEVIAAIQKNEEQLQAYISLSLPLCEEDKSFSTFDICKKLDDGSRNIFVGSASKPSENEVKQLKRKMRNAQSAIEKNKRSAAKTVMRLRLMAETVVHPSPNLRHFRVSSKSPKKTFPAEEKVLVEALHQAARKAGYLNEQALEVKALPVLDNKKTATATKIETAIEMLCIALALKMLGSMSKVPSANRFGRIFDSDPERRKIGENGEKQQVIDYYKWLLNVANKFSFLKSLSGFVLMDNQATRQQSFQPGLFKVNSFADYSGEFRTELPKLFNKYGTFRSDDHESYYTGESENVPQLVFVN